jgi:hypothetical protein
MWGRGILAAMKTIFLDIDGVLHPSSVGELEYGPKGPMVTGPILAINEAGSFESTIPIDRLASSHIFSFVDPNAQNRNTHAADIPIIQYSGVSINSFIVSGPHTPTFPCFACAKIVSRFS